MPGVYNATSCQFCFTQTSEAEDLFDAQSNFDVVAESAKIVDGGHNSSTRTLDGRQFSY
jgi:hypothetical protein